MRGDDALLIEQLPPERRLALAHAPVPARRATLGLLALDARLGATLHGREPIAVQLRFAWWRERLADQSAIEVNADPILVALRSWRDPTCLAVLPEGWEVLLADQLDETVLEVFATKRAQSFVCLAEELQTGARSEIAAAARTWALADLAAHLSDGDERGRVAAFGATLPPPARLPRLMRPLAVLAGLGYRSLKRGGAPLLDDRTSALVALRIGLTGR